MQRLFILLLVLIALACNNEAGGDTDKQVAEETPVIPAEETLGWRLDYDSVTGDPLLKKQSIAIVADSTNASAMVQGLNTLWPEIPLAYQRISGDTVYLHITNSEYLTQRMGSSGPQAYLALLTYTLTEIKEIHFVKLDFEAGDHAAPGTFSRKDFADFIRP